MTAFGDRELISDYRFLEAAAALRDSCARDTQRMVKNQKVQQLRQLQTSVQLSLSMCLHLLVSTTTPEGVENSDEHVHAPLLKPCKHRRHVSVAQDPGCGTGALPNQLRPEQPVGEDPEHDMARYACCQRTTE